ncbi:MAG: hypothetical protein KY446_12080, partial [Proteobacteria bacterium]|nr:hypothetical protein [Pseudomonadota bacterium]
RVALYSPRGRSQVLESPHDEFRVGRMGALYRRELDACLRAGVQWAPSTTVAALEPAGAGSAAALERGGRRERPPWAPSLSRRGLSPLSLSGCAPIRP